jgi:hypothetical protein
VRVTCAGGTLVSGGNRCCVRTLFMAFSLIFATSGWIVRGANLGAICLMLIISANLRRYDFPGTVPKAHWLNWLFQNPVINLR